MTLEFYVNMPFAKITFKLLITLNTFIAHVRILFVSTEGL